MMMLKTKRQTEFTWLLRKRKYSIKRHYSTNCIISRKAFTKNFKQTTKLFFLNWNKTNEQLKSRHCFVLKILCMGHVSSRRYRIHCFTTLSFTLATYRSASAKPKALAALTKYKQQNIANRSSFSN